MSSDWNALDRQAPVPCVRDKANKAFEVPAVKFQFEREQTKTVTKETLTRWSWSSNWSCSRDVVWKPDQRQNLT